MDDLRNACKIKILKELTSLSLIINETNKEFVIEILYCSILAHFAWKLDQTLKITYKLKN